MVPEATVLVSQYEMEQKRVTTPMSFVSEKVCSVMSVIVTAHPLHDVRLCLCRSSWFQPLKSGSFRRLSCAS